MNGAARWALTVVLLLAFAFGWTLSWDLRGVVQLVLFGLVVVAAVRFGSLEGQREKEEEEHR